MTERERWIIYPLLFFALGAALRDKFLQHVTTKEVVCQRLVAKQIECAGGLVCEGVVVLDPENRAQPLVELGRTEPVPAAPGQPARRFGALILRDNNGQVLCGALNDAIYVRQVNCEGVRILDPNREGRILAGLGFVTVRNESGDERPFGVLVLNNEDFGTVTGNPPRDVIRTPPAEGPAPAPAETPAESTDPPTEEEVPAAAEE